MVIVEDTNDSKPRGVCIFFFFFCISVSVTQILWGIPVAVASSFFPSERWSLRINKLYKFCQVSFRDEMGSFQEKKKML